MGRPSKRGQTKNSLTARKNIMSRWQTGKSEGETSKVRPTVYLEEANSSGKRFQNFPKDGENEMNMELPSPDYVLVHSKVWSQIFNSLTCTVCGFQGLEAKFSDTKGFASKVIVECSSCQKIHVDTYTSPRVTNDSSRPPFDVNRKMVDSFLGIGKGHAGMQKFCMTMGMGCMSSSTYNSHLLDSSKESELLQSEVLSMAHKAVCCAHLDLNSDLSEHDTIDISVSYDGTWQRRGHLSIHGIGIIIDVLTGLVIDFEIKSKYCGTCVAKGKELGENSDEYKAWVKNHKESGTCEANYTGSSGSMEAAAAKDIWQRSIALCNMRYTTIVSDGDSKTHLLLQSLSVYGPDIQITKDECLNHIAKRLGTGLRHAVKESKLKGKVLGGKKPGSLKAETIVKLQNYYRSAIKNNVPNVDQMKSAILFATLYHCMSTDEKPQHFKCPGGESSLCFYNRAVAKGDEPPKHEGNRRTFLTSNVVTAIMPVYQRLASTNLLERCTKGKTQNANESLHSLIWNRCPKEVFVSRKKLQIAVISAISEFNMGCEATLYAKARVTASKVSPVSKRISSVRDRRRLKQSTLSTLSTFKSATKKTS